MAALDRAIDRVMPMLGGAKPSAAKPFGPKPDGAEQSAAETLGSMKAEDGGKPSAG
jgi:hypothetical protein